MTRAKFSEVQKSIKSEDFDDGSVLSKLDAFGWSFDEYASGQSQYSRILTSLAREIRAADFLPLEAKIARMSAGAKACTNEEEIGKLNMFEIGDWDPKIDTLRLKAIMNEVEATPEFLERMAAVGLD